MKELMLEVEVLHSGPNAELWARNSLNNSAKYEKYVRPEIDKFIKRYKRKKLMLFRRKKLVLSEEKVPELVEVRVDDPWNATAIHRYYFVREKDR